jgi:hypothetical protein
MSKISPPDTPPPTTMADERRSIEAIARSLGNADARAFGDTSPTPIEWIQTTPQIGSFRLSRLLLP